MTYFIAQLILAVFLALGLRNTVYLIGAQNASLVGKKSIAKYAAWDKKKTSVWSKYPLRNLLVRFSKYIHLEDRKTRQLSVELHRTGLDLTPEQYVCRQYLSASLGVFVCGMVYLAQAYVLFPLGIILTLLLFFKARDELEDTLTKKNEQINKEMPYFVRAIVSAMENDRDIKANIERYMNVAGDALFAELDILLAEMSSGNIRLALIHFDERLANPYISRLVNILNNINKGIDQRASLQYLARDVELYSREQINKELSIRPSKMTMATIPVFISAIVIVVFVFAMYSFRSAVGLAG